MDFSGIFNELIMYIKPGDPIKIACIDYSENNFDKKYDYLLGSNLKSLIYKWIQSIILLLMTSHTEYVFEQHVV